MVCIIKEMWFFLLQNVVEGELLNSFPARTGLKVQRSTLLKCYRNKVADLYRTKSRIERLHCIQFIFDWVLWLNERLAHPMKAS